MERIQAPLADPDAEVLAEYDRLQAELRVAHQTVHELERQLAAASEDLERWQERTMRGPRPAVRSWLKPLLVGMLLGAAAVTAFLLLAGGSLLPG